MTDHVPFVDLRAAQAEIADEVMPDLRRVMREASFIGGEDVAAFEAEYAAFTGVRHCVGVANGTDALELAIRATGLAAGDEVILPANTFIATAEAVVRAGGHPVLVDVDPDTLLIDPERVAAAVTTRTRVVVPVHLYGRLAPVADVRRVVEGRPIAIVEDAAQSQGASRDGVASGAAGTIAATSFYPGKNLGAAGDAGAVTTDDEELAQTVRLLGNHGSRVKYRHDVLGFNSRLDALQAVVLRYKLRLLPEWNQRRRDAAGRYDDLLADLAKLTLPPQAGTDHVWHLYVVRVPERDRVLAHLTERGIGAGIHYPCPVHLTGAFRQLGRGVGSFPVTEAAAHEVLSLPMFPHLIAAQQERVAQELRDLLG